MRFTISNQTHDSLLCHVGKDESVLLVPPFSESAQFSPRRTSLSVWRRSQDKEVVEGTITLTSGRKLKWERVTVQGDLPWVIYRNRITRKQHVLVVFPYRDTSCFLASIPDSVPLSSLMLPGTHETMAFYGWPVSQCQQKRLDTQLHAGIRVIDIRLSVVDGRLIAYHGIFPEVTPFAEMLATLHHFLTFPNTASETVVVSIKQEDRDTGSFPKLVYEEIVASPGGREMWFIENRIPNLGEVRGKAVMFSRFGGDDANGIHPSVWPDSVKEGFQWECDRTLVRTQDWYGVPSFFAIPEKVALCTDILVPPRDSAVPTLSISFMSAASVPFALPPVIARGFGWPEWGLGFEGVNDGVGRWLLDRLSSPACSRTRGWALMDYYEDPVVRLFVECNFRGYAG